MRVFRRTESARTEHARRELLCSAPRLKGPPCLMRALTFLTVCWSSARLASAAAPTPTADFDKVIKPFFDQHCVSCHGEKKQKGDLRVDTLKIDFDSPKTMAHWEEIMN